MREPTAAHGFWFMAKHELPIGLLLIITTGGQPGTDTLAQGLE
jgi:hypothetical protein